MYRVHVALSHCFQNLVEGGKPYYQEKNPQRMDKNQQQIQPTCGVDTWS